MTIALNMGFFLQNVHAALQNQQPSHAAFLLDYAIDCAQQCACPPSPFPLDVAIGLHRGQVRAENQDCVFALHGFFPETHDAFGLFLVADGMGGHAHGQEAAHLAIQVIAEYLLPFLLDDTPPSTWEAILTDGIQHANRVLHLENQARAQRAQLRSSSRAQRFAGTTPIADMGTTVTAVLLVGETAYIANVGDSRTYLSSSGLCRITQDHSVVEQLLTCGFLKDEEERYRHPTRNQIMRAVGIEATVEVDAFVVPLDPPAVLLLCTDGVWEATRDHEIARILASPGTDASSKVAQLVQRANEGGGADNIGCIVLQRHLRLAPRVLETPILDPIEALTTLVTAL